MNDASQLPKERDFDPHDGDLDAQCAWKNFGGLDLNQAYAKFVEAPEAYQEDFMFMGPRALVFYFPVIDRYLREVRSEDEFDGCQAQILGCAMASQLEEYVDEFSKSFLRAIGELAGYVRGHIDQYHPSAKERREIDQKWQEVQKVLPGPH
ncbi:MAG: hypothetical protein CMO80_16375 [Verrucomicrobiales bacterium]|nr:hypothetical protein [Verrucomicrobiales bacterium]|tara:strand:+ start:17 stop:469 length:453 start_codon:yes stop_codon:yes gene_type:complete